jgi:cytochrome c-type biogenesis protein CcmH/NrfG
MEMALYPLAQGSNLEQADAVSEFLYELFAEELQARREHIDRAEKEEREFIISAGFELLGLAQVAPAPLAAEPSAQDRYKELMAEQQAVITDRDGTPLRPGGRPRAASEEDVTQQIKRKKASSSLLDARWILVTICLVVMFGSVYLLWQEYNRDSDKDSAEETSQASASPAAKEVKQVAREPESKDASVDQPDGDSQGRIVRALLEEGSKMLKSNKDDSAVAAFSRAVQLDPANCDANLRLGVTFAKLGKRTKAAKQYQKFVRHCPDHAQAPEVRRVLKEFNEFRKRRQRKKRRKKKR